MCLIVLAHRTHPTWRLVVAANRDEAHERPTRPAAPWPETPRLIAGRDLQSGGTWMGATTSGRFSAVTNFRRPGPYPADAPSRGLLVRDFLLGEQNPADFLHEVKAAADRYAGFSLFASDATDLVYYSNVTDPVRRLDPGVYGLSNHLLDTPWPKVRRAKDALVEILGRNEESGEIVAAMLEMLADRTPASDEELPDTGFGLAMERDLSPIFIRNPHYGTRSSTVLLLGEDGRAELHERSFDRHGGVTGTRSCRFEITS